MIDVHALTRHFGHTAAVDDVSFEIQHHEIVGLLGHNGAGKTTIMRMLSGYLEPSAGRIVIDGHDMATEPASVQQQLGYLPENLPVYPDMVVADYLDYAATLKGIEHGKRQQAIHAAMAATDLGHRALDPIGTLSRGYKQRVGVAQAILGKPRLLILDEPTNGLDPGQVQHMRELVTAAARHATVILSTHILQEVEAVCDRVLILRNGQLALDQQLDKLGDSSTLQLRTRAGVPLAGLEQLPGVAAVAQAVTDRAEQQVSITLEANADPDATANAIARHLLDHDLPLYALEKSARNLEQVFREVADRAG